MEYLLLCREQGGQSYAEQFNYFLNSFRKASRYSLFKHFCCNIVSFVRILRLSLLCPNFMRKPCIDISSHFCKRRNFAKRQLTWFRNEQIYQWIDASKPMVCPNWSVTVLFWHLALALRFLMFFKRIFAGYGSRLYVQLIP